ncbi:exodeoxyribonuclease VII large subunit [Spiroplasma chinense]|uniref:Exodeoxyribonuclease 7 large subunit n=1 Tax=Spiroplasma chinense TaxID=216932 RepID=A0A5B9Y6I8_9MOLU|nr:exodeoxyribonuclease VII large subunit [Spiroplasma chinense]QEH61877.1 exodeoxyribonuclease VII large subunit [Spiroplasma chinense]
MFLKVGELNSHLKEFLEGAGQFKNINIKGEIANLTLNRSGHIYFSLKDNEGKIDCAIWKSNAHKFINLNPSEGTEIIATGSLSFYKPSGKITFTIVDIKIDGVGELNLLYEKRKNELQAKGWFDQEFKKPIPKFPNNIGIVTAATGDAVRDLITTIKRRYPISNIFLFPTLVQGDEAKFDIAKKIKKANQFNPPLDTLIVGRGGGSYEDLWSFNEMEVLEAVRDSNIPIISGVGHEPDYTLIDFVADKRASTPTAAGEAATPDVLNLINALNSKQQEFSKTILTKTSHLRMQFENSIHALYNNLQNKFKNLKISFKTEVEKLSSSFDNKINVIKKHLKTDLTSLHSSLKTKLELYKREVKMLDEKLEILDPRKPLEKGFAIIKQNNKIVFSINDVDKNNNVIAQLKDGQIDMNIIDLIKEEE